MNQCQLMAYILDD